MLSVGCWLAVSVCLVGLLCARMACGVRSGLPRNDWAGGLFNGFVLVQGLVVDLVLVSLICVFIYCVFLVGSARLCGCGLLFGVAVLAAGGCVGGGLVIMLFWY